MFPPLNLNRPKRPKTNPRYLPISPSDNALTTGQLINPVGSMYQANPNPTTAMFGALGTFGANLPTVNVGGAQPTQGPYQRPFTSIPAGANVANPQPLRQLPALFQNPNQARVNPNQLPGLGVAGGGRVGGIPWDEGQMSPYGSVPTEQISQINNQYQVANITGNPNLLPPNLTAAQAYQSGFTAQPGFNQLYTFNTQTRNYQLKPQGLKDNTATASAGNTDFMQTKFMQENVANNVNFYNQLRWDPESKRYQKIGNLIRQGKLDVKSGKKPKRKGGGGGGQEQSQQTSAPQAQATETPAQFGYSTTANFNTATG